MNEQFDKTLRNHIRDTFDHFDDGMADDGWKKFSAQKNKKRRALIFWYSMPSGIAAALALLWLLNLNTTETVKPQNNQFAAKQQVEPLNSNPSNSKNNSNKAEQSENLGLAQTVSPKTESQQVYTTQSKKTQKDIVSDEPRFVNTQIANTISVENPTNQNQETPINNLSIETLAQNTIGNSSDNESITSINKTTEPNSEELSIEQKSILLANALNAIPENNLNQTAKKTANSNKKFNVAIDANTFYSFSNEGINDQLNLGLGLATEFKIAKNLSINSGISINRQTTNFEGNEKSVTSLLDSKNTLSNPGSAGFSPSSGVPQPEEGNAKLTGLDIPLNLKLDIKMGKAKTFITTGISSYSVINEKYVNDFTVTNSTFKGTETSKISNTVKNPSGKFSSFEFARTLNFSFGVVYPINQKHAISLEPFVKYPLAGFGYQDLKIGSGGLSFKLNFGK